MTAPLLTEPDVFEALVHQAVATGHGGSFGHLHVVRIRAAAPEAPLPAKAQAIAESILQRRLGASDSCLRLNAGQYLLLFPALNETEGRIRATALAHEIKQHLTGADAAGLDVASEILPLAALKSAAAPPSVATMRRAMAGAALPALALSVEFQPVWDMAEQTLIGSRARIRREFGDLVMWERQTMFGGDDDPLAVEVNRQLANAGGAFRPDRGTLFLPLAINAHTLAEERGLENALDRACSVGGARLVVELAGAVAQLGRPALRAAISTIRARGAAVAVRVVPERDTARFLHDCGAQYLCLNHAQAQTAGFTPSALYALYTLVARDADGLGFTLALWNATSPEDVKRAAALGFSLFSGAPIGPTQPLAGAPRPVGVSAVFA